MKRFLERADDYQGVPVFYQATREWLHTLRRLRPDVREARRGGATCRCREFTLDGGGTAKTLRMTLRRVLKDGVAFRVVPASGDHPGAPGRTA